MRDTEYLDIAYRVAPLVELEAHGALSVCLSVLKRSNLLSRGAVFVATRATARGGVPFQGGV